MTAVPVWAQLVYLACAVGFILALKGLSGPRTARTGNLVGAAAGAPGPIVCHGAVEAMNAVYRQDGIALPETLAVDSFGRGAAASAGLRRALVLAPPSAGGSPWRRRRRGGCCGSPPNGSSASPSP